MTRIYANPFSWGDPVSGSHYVSRPKEESQVATAIEKQLHLIITGGRGNGKTSLVQHVLEQSSIASAYLDFTFAVSRNDLIRILLNAMASSFPRAVKEGRTARLEPTTDEGAALAPTLNLWYDLVKESSQKFTMVWDAAHFLVKMKDDVLGEMREILRERRGITHIFISHREDVLNEIFEDQLNPFFYQREMLYVKNIMEADFEKYLTQSFRRMGLSDFDLARTLLRFSHGQPQLTQRMAHSLAQLWLEGNTTRLVDRTIEKLLKELHTRYTSNWDDFGLNERRLLVGLAAGYSHPTELEFIRMYGLSATSTAHNTVLKLLREGWIINRQEGYHILDPLFLKWLTYHREAL